MGEWRVEQIGDLGLWRRGRGPNHVLVLHGGPGLSEYTEDLGDLLAAALADEDAWTIARFQQRGLAPSTTTGPFTVEQHVADTLRVCDSMTGEPIALVGHSWGGHLAMHVAVAASDRVRAAVIIDPLGAVPDGGMAAMGEHFAAHLTDDESAARARIAERSAAEGPSAELELEDLAILWRYYFADPRTAPPMPPFTMSVDAYAETVVSVGEHFKNDTLVRGLPEISTPVLFIAGTNSPIPFVESERSAELLRNGEAVTIPTGHFPWIEAPAQTISTIVEFLLHPRRDA